jgi:hypothetical protein
MVDYNKLWNSWGKEGQTAYLWGYMDGGGNVLLATAGEILKEDKKTTKMPKDFYETIRIKTAILHDPNKLIEVMTNLYKDPSNSYIWLNDMVIIARDSLSGNDVSKAILEARKIAIKNHELSNK